MANNTFQIRRTTVAGRTPNTTNSANSTYINIGELALNLTDSILYSANATSGLITVGSNLTSTSIGGGALIANSSRITITGVPLSANGSVGTQGQVLKSNGAIGSPYWDTASSGGGSPGGSTTQIQYNDAGVFAGSAAFTFNKTTDTISIGNSTVNSTINSTSFTFSDSTTQTTAATLGKIYATAAGFAMP